MLHLNPKTNILMYFYNIISLQFYNIVATYFK